MPTILDYAVLFGLGEDDIIFGEDCDDYLAGNGFIRLRNRSSSNDAEYEAELERKAA